MNMNVGSRPRVEWSRKREAIADVDNVMGDYVLCSPPATRHARGRIRSKICSA